MIITDQMVTYCVRIGHVCIYLLRFIVSCFCGVCVIYIFFIFFFYVVSYVFFMFFFFSSRRRHTRSYGDWSSDVCSSDLKLTGREEQALAVTPTDNPKAYDAYLHGVASEPRAHTSFSHDLAEKAIGFYERAVQLDPNFALAWARLSREDALFYFNLEMPNRAARGDAAKRALENA